MNDKMEALRVRHLKEIEAAQLEHKMTETVLTALDLPADTYTSIHVAYADVFIRLQRGTLGAALALAETMNPLAMYRVIKENRQLRHTIDSQYSFGNIIGKSRPMQEIFATINKVAPTSATVLVEGESGTGKELVAKSIHFNSPRRQRSFVAVNCAALAETLLESELFGHEKGAFTGAAAKKKGRFELADGGTLFLDEIGELSQALQVKLLRVLQDRTFERVGGEKQVTVDIRLVAATNKTLRDEVQQGRFREDLFYRLNVVSLTLPPLRQRQADIRLLTAHFIERYEPERKADIPIAKVAQEVERLFLDYSWPGNVRELENVIERAMILCPGDTIGISDLPKDFVDSAHNTLHIEGIATEATLYETLAFVEKRMIERALHVSDNIQSRAAALLGIGKSNLNQKIKKLGLTVGTK